MFVTLNIYGNTYFSLYREFDSIQLSQVNKCTNKM